MITNNLPGSAHIGMVEPSTTRDKQRRDGVPSRQTSCDAPLNADRHRRIEAAKSLGLDWQSEYHDFLGRVRAAKEGGYSQTTLQDLVSQMAGKPVRKLRLESDPSHRIPFHCDWPFVQKAWGRWLRPVWEWGHLSETDEPLDWCSWGNGYWLARQYIEVGGWFRRETFVVTRLPLLRTRMPYGVMLKVMEAQETGLFDSFSVVAPEPMVKAIPSTVLDPAIIGSVYNLGYAPAEMHDCGGEAHFVIARWQ